MKLITITLCFIYCITAAASSCIRTSDRIIAYCKNGQCSEIFYVKEVRTGAACQRRPTVIDPPFWAKAVIEKEIANSDLPHQNGGFELMIRNSWYSPVMIINADDYFIHKNYEDRRFGIDSELHHLPGASLLNLLSEWQEKETQGKKQELLNNQSSWIGYLIIFIFLIFVVVKLVYGIKKRNC